MLLLVNYRPEYQHRWGSKSLLPQLRLDSLRAESAAESLLRAAGRPILGSRPSAHADRADDGNPFFLEESVRTLVETGVLVGEPGAYRLARPVERLQVPATVQAILAARIDRLPAGGQVASADGLGHRQGRALRRSSRPSPRSAGGAA